MGFHEKPCFNVFVWSQYDGGNMEQRTIGCRQNQEAKLKIVGGAIPWSN